MQNLGNRPYYSAWKLIEAINFKFLDFGIDLK